MNREAAPPGAPRPRRRLLAEALSVAAVYGVVLIGAAAYAGSALAAAPRLPGLEDALPLVLLGLLPLALLAVFAARLRRLVIDARLRLYGARLRLRLVGLFLLVAALAALPQGAFLLRLAWTAQAEAGSEVARRAAAGGLALALEYYGEDLARLERLALRELPALDGGRLAVDPEATLEGLRAREPRMESVELFLDGRSVAYAGPPGGRLESAPAPGAAGPMAASSAVPGEEARLRYAALRPRAEGGEPGVAVLTLRPPRGFGEAAADLAEAGRRAEAMAPFSLRWALVLAVLYAFLVLPLLLLAALLGLQAADLVVEPLAGLEAATRRVASGELSLRLLVKPGDETGRLVASFNRMLAEIERYRSDDLRKGRIDAWRDIAQRLAHELKNPLTPIRLAAERVLRLHRSDPARAAEILEGSMLAVIAAVEGMDALLGDFRAFASLPEPQREWSDLRALVEESFALYRASYPEVEFRADGVPEGLSLRLDRAQWKRALGNLLSNAVDAMDGRGVVDARADLVKTADSRYCRFRLSDSGRGIPAGTGSRIFAPYFTTKASGTGLGLSIVERIVTDHGGSVRFESEEGTGTSFYIDLPFDK